MIRMKYTHFQCKIAEVIQESDVTRSFLLDTSKNLEVSPGQFVMVWVPGKSEKNIPLSYAAPFEQRVGFTIKKKAPAPSICEICNSCGVCEEIFDMKIGDTIRIRGPYGNGFTIQGKNLLMFGHETRAAPLVFLAEKAREMSRKVTFIVAAPTENRLPFIQRLKDSDIEVLSLTEKELVKDPMSTEEMVDEFIEKKSVVDAAYLSAPERISKPLLDVLGKHNIPTQVMVERHIHCGVGICGECVIDPTGWRACVEGPVFSDVSLRDSEFGKYRRHSLKKSEIQKGQK